MLVRDLGFDHYARCVLWATSGALYCDQLQISYVSTGFSDNSGSGFSVCKLQ